MDRQEILKKVQAKEREAAFKARCLAAEVCPKCGGDTKVKYDARLYQILLCTNCGGEYPI
jgi:hypothetical protein